MSYSHGIHHRRSIRLKGYDYTQAGGYFITICTHHHECLFGEIIDGKMHLNDAGNIVGKEWEKSAVMRTEIELGEYVIMPNHFHAVVFIVDQRNGKDVRHRGIQCKGIRCRGIRPDAPTWDAPTNDISTNNIPTNDIYTIDADTMNVGMMDAHAMGPAPKSIGALMAGFKSAATKHINVLHNCPGMPVWQRNYWEHIIRNQKSYIKIAEYIINNPVMWRDDYLFVG